MKNKDKCVKCQEKNVYTQELCKDCFLKKKEQVEKVMENARIK